MTFADHVANVAVGLMSDPNFKMTATLYSDIATKDAFGNRLAPSYTSIAVDGFFDETPRAKTIEAEGTEPRMSARFYTYDVTTAMRLRDKIAYGGNAYLITAIGVPEIAGKKMYRYLDLQLSEAKV